jgi:release factor glutamine methyltransferase
VAEWQAMATTGGHPVTTVEALVATIAERFAAAGIPTARQEARDLVAACLDEARFWPTLHRDDVLPPASVALILAAAERRLAGAPFAYAVGRAAFRHLVLAVDPRVLIPRAETEQLVEEVLGRTDGGHGVVADIGTGSGAIALALAAEGGFARVVATDVSADALAVAQGNAASLAGALRAPVEFRLGHGTAPLAGERLAALVSNPPYIAWEEARELPASVRDWEPPTALFAGEGGMAVIAQLVAGAMDLLVPGGLLALEVDSRRAEEAAVLARNAGFADVHVVRDLAERDRFLFATRP